MPKKLTLSEFKFKARQVHKNKDIKCYGKSNIILSPLM